MRYLAFCAVTLVALAACGLGWHFWSASDDAAAAQTGEYPLQTVSAAFFEEYQSLRLERWEGPIPPGIISEEDIRAAAEMSGDVAEIALVQVSQSTRGTKGMLNLSAPGLEEASSGPVWVVVYSDHPAMRDADPEATAFVNVQFLSPGSGQVILGIQAALVPSDAR